MDIDVLIPVETVSHSLDSAGHGWIPQIRLTALLGVLVVDCFQARVADLGEWCRSVEFVHLAVAAVAGYGIGKGHTIVPQEELGLPHIHLYGVDEHTGDVLGVLHPVPKFLRQTILIEDDLKCGEVIVDQGRQADGIGVNVAPSYLLRGEDGE